MANVINTSLTWSQEDARKYFLQPLFYENNHLKGMDVISDVSGASILLDRYTSIKDITKSMACTSDCFSADGTQSTNNNVELTLCRLEVEHAQKACSLMSHIKSQLMKKGVNRADLTGTLFMEIVSALVMQGIARDFSTILWWGDTTNGASESTQKLCNGVWQYLSSKVGGDLPTAQVKVFNTDMLTTLQDMMNARSTELATADRQIIYVSRAFADAYRHELQSAGTHVAAYSDLINGIPNLSYNGIPMIVVNSWDVDIATYGASLANMTNGLAPNATADTKAAIWTMEDNITIGTDYQAQDVDMWYNKDCKENRFRMLYSMGVAVKEPGMVVTMTQD